jgi:hypothetical protein
MISGDDGAMSSVTDIAAAVACNVGRPAEAQPTESVVLAEQPPARAEARAEGKGSAQPAGRGRGIAQPMGSSRGRGRAGYGHRLKRFVLEPLLDSLID